MKRGKKMILLLALLCVLLGGYAMIGQLNEKASVSESRGSYPLWPDGKTVSSLRWTHNGEEFAFSLGESVWMKDDDASFPVNQTVLGNLADRVQKLTAVSELTDVTKPEDYGLDEPSFSVTVVDEDGGETVYAMGDQTPFADGYYLSVSGRNPIYVIETTLADTFGKTLTQLATMETMPEVTEISRMTIGSTLDVTCEKDAGVWKDTVTGEALDSEAVTALTEEARNLSWSELIATGATDEELNAWGLDDAQAVKLTLYNGETPERTLLLGGADEEGNRYARLADSGMVYTFHSTDVDPLLEAGADTLYMKKLPGMTAEQIGEMAFVWDGGEAVLKSSDSDSTTMQGIIDHLNALEGTARVEIGEPGDTILTLNVTDGDGGAQAYAFHAYNVDSYLMPVTGSHGILMPAQDVDKLIRMLKQIP